jgi:hypothetical protein|tara:strand:+ start:6975 stop:7409 length:435 start_codon:yes stop_codon:yes gene_type:complete
MATITAGIYREYDRLITMNIRTNYEQIRALPIDTVSGIVYNAVLLCNNADELSNPHQGRQAHYGMSAKPSRCPTVMLFRNMLLGIFLPFTYLTQRVARGTQTRLRKDNITRYPHTKVRKGILNSLEMRKSCSLKEKQYGKKLNG